MTDPRVSQEARRVRMALGGDVILVCVSENGTPTIAATAGVFFTEDELQVVTKVVLDTVVDEVSSVDDDRAAARTVASYRIWSHEHEAWWRPDGTGYTGDVTEAGLYSYEEAAEIVVPHVPPGQEVAVLVGGKQSELPPPSYRFAVWTVPHFKTGEDE